MARARNVFEVLKEGGVVWDRDDRLNYNGEVDEDSNVIDLVSDLISYRTRDNTPLP